MAEISLNVPNDQVGRVVDALCIFGGYTGDPNDVPARRAFAKHVLGDQLRQIVLRVERTEAAATAMASVTVDPITID